MAPHFCPLSRGSEDILTPTASFPSHHSLSPGQLNTSQVRFCGVSLNTSPDEDLTLTLALTLGRAGREPHRVMLGPAGGTEGPRRGQREERGRGAEDGNRATAEPASHGPGLGDPPSSGPEPRPRPGRRRRGDGGRPSPPTSGGPFRAPEARPPGPGTHAGFMAASSVLASRARGTPGSTRRAGGDRRTDERAARLRFRVRRRAPESPAATLRAQVSARPAHFKRTNQRPPAGKGRGLGGRGGASEEGRLRRKGLPSPRRRRGKRETPLVSGLHKDLTRGMHGLPFSDGETEVSGHREKSAEAGAPVPHL